MSLEKCLFVLDVYQNWLQLWGTGLMVPAAYPVPKQNLPRKLHSKANVLSVK